MAHATVASHLHSHSLLFAPGHAHAKDSPSLVGCGVRCGSAPGPQGTTFGALKQQPSSGRTRHGRAPGAALVEGGSVFLEDLEFDVVVVGAGVIGLTVANRILEETTFSVAVVDAKRPCAGATGAGQGYVWMNHRTPASTTWGLAHRGKLLWEQLVADLAESGSDPLTAIGWQNTGSLLVATSAEEVRGLEAHVEQMAAAGVDAEFLTAADLRTVEPSLKVGHEGGAAFVRGDSQIDAALAVALVRKRNSAYRAQGRYVELFESPVERLYRSSVDGSIEVVQTSRHKLHCREAVVLAAGAWSSKLLAQAAEEWSLPLIPSVKPRKGHLLVLEGLPQLTLNHGLMEFEYTANYAKVQSALHSQPEDVSVVTGPAAISDDSFQVAMTASMDACGRLLLGSSREFSGFSTAHHFEAIEGILNRASKFLPALMEVSVQDILEKETIRTGLRPYVLGGVPLIGPVPEVEGLMLATGHEGSGLCMALGTAEILVATLLGKEAPLDIEAYLPAGRLCHSKACA
ncbi:hypothetical protein M758_4G209200 [Ceratodon purpureus]|nr:hypothetical protein M758_4G209200 [Ceratodon purpureus]